MKLKIVLLLICLFVVSAFAQNNNLPNTVNNYSLSLSMVEPEEDFKRFWEDAKGLSLGWFYPFDKQLYVESAINFSYHSKILLENIPNGYQNPEDDLRLFTMSLSAWIVINEKLPKPIIGINDFLALFDKWYIIEADADEQELGFHFGLAYNYKINNKISIITDIRRYYVATSPKFLYYEILRLGLIYSWGDKN